MCAHTCISHAHACMCMDTYFHQPYCLIFTFRLHAQPAGAHIKMYASQLACCSACWWLTNGKGDAREKEVV